MLSLSSGFNYYLCSEPVTLRYRHAGLRNYIKSQLHRDPTNGDIYIFLSKDSHRVRIYYFHHQGEILTEKILHSNHFVEPVFDEKKRCYHISWESFVYLVEGIVLKDRKVAFIWTAGIDHAILRNVIVVADALEASCLVAGFQCFYREVLVNTCGTAMYHDQIDFSWILHRILWILKDKCLILHTDLTDLTDFPFRLM